MEEKTCTNCESPQPTIKDLEEKIKELEKENAKLRKTLSIFDKVENSCYKNFRCFVDAIEKHDYQSLFVNVSKMFVTLIVLFFFLGVLFTNEPLVFITFICLVLTSVFSWCLFINIRHKFQNIEETLKSLEKTKK